jgi:hypothetical protein
MREYFTYGSVRGAAGNGGPYRDPHIQIGHSFLERCEASCLLIERPDRVD